MTFVRPLTGEQEPDQMDRRLIRVECPTSQAGIAAALRRAFQTPGVVPACESDFETLLSRLN